MTRPSRWIPDLGRDRRFVPALLALSVAGAVASLVIHTVAVFDRELPWGFLAFALVPGVFVVWPVVVIEAMRLDDRGSRATTEPGMSWSRVLRGVPLPMRVVAWCVAAFAACTLVTEWFLGPSVGPDRAPAEQLPLFVSVVPLAFYSAAALVLVSGMCVPPSAVRPEQR